MAERGELSFGQVVRGTVETATANVSALAIYVAVLTGVGAASELVPLAWFNRVSDESEPLATLQTFSGLGVGLAGIAIFLAGLVAQYFLWEAMLRNAGLAKGIGRHRYLAFIGQSILIVVASMFGYVLLVVPGLIMTARWSLAPALLVTSDLGVIEAMRRSWETVRGNSTPVILVLLAAGVVVWLAALVLGGLGTLVAGMDPSSVVLRQFLSHVQAALFIAMAVFLYRRLYDDTGELREVFA